jgi:hypothetical protein
VRTIQKDRDFPDVVRLLPVEAGMGLKPNGAEQESIAKKDVAPEEEGDATSAHERVMTATRADAERLPQQGDTRDSAGQTGGLNGCRRTAGCFGRHLRLARTFLVPCTDAHPVNSYPFPL